MARLIMRHESGGDERRQEAFWRFSLALYARPGVAQALIALQDGAGRNVNLILFALWLGVSEGRRLDTAALAAAEAAISPLDTAAITPLRALRRQLKATAGGDLQSLRQRILALELTAERSAQHRLVQLFPSAPGERAPGDRLAAAEANLVLYLGASGRSPEPRRICEALAALIRAGS